MKKKLLFISHDATRTGAPIQLFEVANWFKNKPEYEVSVIVVYERGELLENYRSTFNPIFVFKKNKHFIEKLFAPNEMKTFVRQVKRQNPDLIFLNTIASGVIVEALKDLGIPVVSRIPEMANTIRKYGELWLEKIEKASKKIISPSLFAKKQLVHDFDIDNHKIEVISGFIPEKRIGKDTFEHKQKDETTVLMVGLWSWRKGGDLFLKTAYDFKKKYPKDKVRFKWIGLPKDSKLFQEVDFDIHMMGLENMVEIISPTDEIIEHYQDAEIFFLTSREDPMPIVGLEAASNYCIVTCFKGSGGMDDFVQNSGVDSIPYSDTEAAADYIHSLIHLKETDFNQLKEKAKNLADSEYSYEKIMSKIETLINEVLNES